jgi:hypothetical protein
MQNQMEPAVSNRLGRNNYRATARAVGVVFLAGMVVYILGNAVLSNPFLAHRITLRRLRRTACRWPLVPC